MGMRIGEHKNTHPQKPQHTIAHVQHTLHFTTKISVPRCINDVDLGALVPYSGVFGQDGNTTLTLQVVAVHDAILHNLVIAKYLGLLEHGIHKGGLAMIDVCNCVGGEERCAFGAVDV